ncbi:hypothetical protein Trydic_g2633 [Trypoxylus dichotomus]
MKTLAIFVFVMAIAVVHGGVVGGVHASVVPGSVVVGGGVGHLGWGGLGGLGGLGAWGGHWGPWGGLGWLGAGHDGQWVPDNSELLYDDGSYKPAVYGW